MMTLTAEETISPLVKTTNTNWFEATALMKEVSCCVLRLPLSTNQTST